MVCVCRKGAVANNILCSSRVHWVHHGCSGIKGKKLKEDPRTVRQIGARPCSEFVVDNDIREAVDSFCYLECMQEEDVKISHHTCKMCLGKNP